MIFTTTLLTSCVKLLLIPAYRSTDFEVHRNWLAITHSLPLNKWYFEETSQWTLDYPPLFAYFEYLLSLLARFFDVNMLNLNNLNYESTNTVLFQRLTVIVTDLFYAYGTYKCCSSIQKSWKTEVVLPILLITNCGLLMVDHIHFQYNGIMYGILLLSIAYSLQGRHLLSAFWFTILLNMKHIYMYLAPAYFIYLLRHYCIGSTLPTKLAIIPVFKRLALLGSIVISIFLVMFIPFYDQLGQLLTRMFPFKRGLCHAYWAPNFWAIYNTIDKGLYFALSRLGFLETKGSGVASMTGGLVQEFSHSVLPNITPFVTIILSAIMMLPALIKLWRLQNSHVSNFLRCLVLCGLTSFLFGWHVHEKAISMVVIPLSILSVMGYTDAKVFGLLAVAAHYSLFPLLFPDSLLLVKSLLLILYSVYAFHSLSKAYHNTVNKCYALPLLNQVETVYVLGFVVLFLYENFVHRVFGLNEKYQFLPLMLTSIYCSMGIIYCWLIYYYYFLTNCNETSVKNIKLK